MRALFATSLVLGCGAAAALAQASSRLDYEPLLRRMVIADWLWQPPLAGERCVQFSSYDRRSQAGPADPDAWYANGDRGQYLGVVETAAGREHILADVQGPGCVARLWSANPQGTLHFDLDGTRVWSVDFAALCSGKLAGVPEPLAGMRSQGGNCYLPIPFQHSLVIAATAADLYYAVDVVQWAPGTVVPSFDPAWLATQAAAIQRVCGELTAPSLPPAGAPPSGAAAPAALVVPARSLVTALQVVAPPATPPAAVALAMRTCRLVVRSGDEVTVDVPLAAFFAAGPDWRPWQSARFVVTGTTATVRWPMPFPQSGRVELVGSEAAAEVPLGLRLQTESLPSAPGTPLLFRANYHLAKGTPTRPFGDHVVLDAKGRGRFVGCSLLVRNPSRVWWGEGDERFTIDGEAFPSWFGTGTEDYFGYAWCDPTPFQAPFHAQIVCQGPGNFGFTQLHRSHLLDSVPFERSCHAVFERWHWVPTTQVDYETVAYWYGAAGATAGLPPVPAAADRALPALDGPPVFVAEGALEGEALRVLACTGGSHEVQDLGIFERLVSRDAHRWWRGGRPQDALVLAVPVPAAGRYRVTAAFVMADDFGIVQCGLAGQALGAPFDGYAAAITSSGPRELGSLELPAGEVEFRLQLVGKNEAAKPSHMVGLDYLRLERLP
jgi:hypothetical protein